MDYHMQVLAEKMGLLADDLTQVFRFLEPVRVEVYGTPGDRAMEMDKPLMESGVPFTFQAAACGRVHALVGELKTSGMRIV